MPYRVRAGLNRDGLSLTITLDLSGRALPGETSSVWNP